MTYTPKVGDIVSAEFKVVSLTTAGDGNRVAKVEVNDSEMGPFYVEYEHLELVSRPKRELKPGDRIRHKHSDKEYLALKSQGDMQYMVSLVQGKAGSWRDQLNFDQCPEDWEYFPRNETPEP